MEIWKFHGNSIVKQAAHEAACTIEFPGNVRTILCRVCFAARVHVYTIHEADASLLIDQIHETARTIYPPRYSASGSGHDTRCGVGRGIPHPNRNRLGFGI